MQHTGVYGTEVLNIGNTPAILADLAANRPVSPGITGLVFIATDTGVGTRWNGTTWTPLWPAAGSGVTSFGTPGRTGAVVPITGDYTSDMVTEGVTNLYFTNTRARAAFTGSTNIAISVGGVVTLVDPVQVNTIQKAGGGTGGQITLNNQQLLDNTGALSIQYDARRLRDTAGNNAILWGNRTCADTGGNIVLNWATQQLMTAPGGTPTIKLDWSVLGLVDIPVSNLQVAGLTAKTLKFANASSAPGTNAAGAVTNRYGGATNFLGDPTVWGLVNIAGTEYKLPLY